MKTGSVLKLGKVIVIFAMLLVGLGIIPAARAATISDVFPAALSHYAYGGWQGPFGDGTAGRLFPTADGTGIYADATYNGLVWALRSSPEFSSIDMSMHFSIPNRDFTSADYFALLLLLHSPTTPPSTPPGTNCDGTCSYVSAQSGVKLLYRIGFNQLVITNGPGNITLSQVPLPAVALNQPHEARAVYTAGNLSVYLDGGLIVNLQTTNVPSGQVGFETYRTDLIMNSITLTSPPAQKLSISLTGSFDYLLQETVPIQIAGLVTSASTGQPVSGANVTIQIVDTSGNTIVSSTTMVENSPGTGVYIWTSNATIQRLHLPKGLYLATVTATLSGGPTASAILSFHIDPPMDIAPQPVLSTPWIIAITLLASSSATAIIAIGLQRMRRLRQAVSNTLFFTFPGPPSRVSQPRTLRKSRLLRNLQLG